ncbi:DBH-like monooxygenase protein 1 homolog [Corticium candelabrum]|uniref:DBH-like monooxygenase protein 1 homolog n=1 Tax=Corticium candelabrum TaxID=121492 RepID=UPI002E272D5E|nr:DBH-like monooxygenase protein 1 homolog [Corticium candelabrum]
MFASSRIAALLILSCSVNVVVRCDQHLCPTGYSRSACLDDIECKYLLCWKVNWPDETITFVSKVATTGWIGFGVSPTGMMSNSDVVIGWVANGQGYLKDRFANARVMPPIDAKQNVELLSAEESNGTTTLVFRRKLSACEDPEKDLSIETGPVWIIWSYHDSDPVSENSVTKHSAKGSKEINVLSGTGDVQAAPLPADHQTMDLLNNAVKRNRL